MCVHLSRGVKTTNKHTYKTNKMKKKTIATPYKSRKSLRSCCDAKPQVPHPSKAFRVPLRHLHPPPSAPPLQLRPSILVAVSLLLVKLYKCVFPQHAVLRRSIASVQGQMFCRLITRISRHPHHCRS